MSQNKFALIDLCEDLIKHKKDFQRRCLVITESHPVSVELCKGLTIQKRYLETNQEEADTIILYQLAVVIPLSAIVVADDTDIFVLLCHFRHLGMITSQVWMISPIKGGSVIDISASVANNNEIKEDLPMHSLSGCDTVTPCFRTGKGVALSVLRSQN